MFCCLFFSPSSICVRTALFPLFWGRMKKVYNDLRLFGEKNRRKIISEGDRNGRFSLRLCSLSWAFLCRAVRCHNFFFFFLLSFFFFIIVRLRHRGLLKVSEGSVIAPPQGTRDGRDGEANAGDRTATKKSPRKSTLSFFSLRRKFLFLIKWNFLLF